MGEREERPLHLGLTFVIWGGFVCGEGCWVRSQLLDTRDRTERGSGLAYGPPVPLDHVAYV